MAAPDLPEYISDRVEEKPAPEEKASTLQVTQAHVPHLRTKAHAAEQFRLNSKRWENWNGLASCQPSYFHRPETKEHILEVLEWARKHEENVRVVGCGYSMADIACTDGHMISLERFCRILKVNKSTVKVESGITLSTLNERLSEVGLALPILPFISSQSVAGAISTGSHGTGIGYGILATLVEELELILADCTEIVCSRSQNTEIFLAALCSLGSLGVISTLTLRCENSFHLDSVQYPLPIESVLTDINKIISSAEHIRIWWFPHTDKCIVWQANRSNTPPSPSHTSLRKKLNQITENLVGHYAMNLTYQLSHYNGRVVPYLNRIYRRLLFNSTKAEYDLSYKVFSLDNLIPKYIHSCCVPVENVQRATNTIRKMISDKKYPVHFPVEITFVKSDDIWLSPAYGGDKAFISLVLYNPSGTNITNVKYFYEFEQKMINLGGRPQWGQFHSPTWQLDAIQKSYPKFKDFVKIREKLDPNKLFNNQYLMKLFEEV